MSNQREAALKSAEDSLARVREGFESADAHRLGCQWTAERSMVKYTREAIIETIEHLTTLRGLL